MTTNEITSAERVARVRAVGPRRSLRLEVSQLRPRLTELIRCGLSDDPVKACEEMLELARAGCLKGLAVVTQCGHGASPLFVRLRLHRQNGEGRLQAFACAAHPGYVG